MWEAAAFGPAHEALARHVAEGVQVSLALVRDTPKGRRVVVTLRGERRARRAAMARLLPGFVRLLEEAPGSGPLERIEGHLPPPASSNGDAAGTLWPTLQRFEAEWLGEAGSVLLAGLRDGHLALKGVADGPMDEERLAGAARILGGRLRLFAPGGVSATVRPFPLGGGDTEPAWQLKRTEIEAARAALALGYYENPRRCTMEDIARVLGITKSAVYHRIHGLEQKAVRRLVHQHGPAEAVQLPEEPRHHVERALIPASVAAPAAWVPPRL